MVERKLLAKWVSVGLKYWVELRKHTDDDGCLLYYSYRSDNGGGPLVTAHPVMQDEKAIRVMQARVNLRRFLPDDAVMPMRRVV
jgi:hypothetical protein